MTDFLRPEVRALLLRWREAIVGAVVALLGLRLMVTGIGLAFLTGLVLAAVGAALVFTGVMRARFRRSGRGSGVVDVDERQITYFGPFGGGAMAVGEIAEIAVDPHACWRLRDTGGQVLLIPMNAEGADTLLDAFAALPGLAPTTLVAAVNATPRSHTVLWTSPRRRLH